MIVCDNSGFLSISDENDMTLNVQSAYTNLKRRSPNDEISSFSQQLSRKAKQVPSKQFHCEQLSCLNSGTNQCGLILSITDSPSINTYKHDFDPLTSDIHVGLFRAAFRSQIEWLPPHHHIFHSWFLESIFPFLSPGDWINMSRVRVVISIIYQSRFVNRGTSILARLLENT